MKLCNFSYISYVIVRILIEQNVMVLYKFPRALQTVSRTDGPEFLFRITKESLICFEKNSDYETVSSVQNNSSF